VTEPEQQPQSFAAFVCQLRRGQTEHELSTQLTALVEAVEETGKTGTLTYTIKVAPAPNAEHTMVITDDVKTKLPTLDRPASIFFADESFRLVRTDPRQLSFEQAFAEQENH
jgi:hypothetical protein